MTPTFPDLAGKSVFITGGGNGIGAVLTDAFLGQGPKVAFIGRSDASAFVHQMGAKHGNAPLFIQGDITDTEGLRAAIDQAATAHGPVQVLVNNAAFDMRYDATEITPQIWDDMTAVNLKAYFFACQKVVEGMPDGGVIVNYSSISYMIGSTRLVPYTASNAGIMGMTRSLAREWGPRGIRINALAPGWVMTERQEREWATPEALHAHLDTQALKTIIRPEDMVGGTLFLASSASAMMTGQVIAIDGGVSMLG
ncbi:MAG: SDR family NAD(P)-dependent oxidoreductase [Yoonia sp.]|nr:SDR family NAD(P)-dependent oxidoreductase [Yoonia sp.]